MLITDREETIYLSVLSVIRAMHFSLLSQSDNEINAKYLRAD